MASTSGIILIGAGSRGLLYSNLIKYFIDNKYCSDELKIVGVADPKRSRINLVRKIFPNIQNDMTWSSWSKLAKTGIKKANAIIIATQDKKHSKPAIAFANLGYKHILLEKPMATTARECQLITNAVLKNNVSLTLCHVMKYTFFWSNIKEVIKNGHIGVVTDVNLVEEVGYHHYRSSFVSGDWNNANTSSPFMCAKSIHDIDMINWLLDVPCIRVSSFGNLLYFRPENKPSEAGTAKRCIDCAYEHKCEYSAYKIHIRDKLDANITNAPLKHSSKKITQLAMAKAILNGK